MDREGCQATIPGVAKKVGDDSATRQQQCSLQSIATVWKQPKRPSVDEWIKKMSDTHTDTHTHTQRENITKSLKRMKYWDFAGSPVAKT